MTSILLKKLATTLCHSPQSLKTKIINIWLYDKLIEILKTLDKHCKILDQGKVC